jgi:hypothetical protein
VCESWFYRGVCRQGVEIWLTVNYMKLCVGRMLDSVWQLVTWSCV